MRSIRRLSVVVLLTLAIPASATAQTAATATVLGTVTDPQQAVVAGAAVELRDTGTNEVRTQTTNSAGQYSFPGVAPGVYKITVTMQGFKTVTISNFNVDVNKSHTVNFKLELGQLSEVLQVEAGAAVELQTTDAQIGNDVSSDAMLKLPTLRRNAAALLTLQPGVSPGTGTFPRVGMRVAGAVDDQNTFTLDGIDVSDNVIGGLEPATIAVIPLGVEAVDEYRVGVSNPNATFGRASGGQIAVVGKRGTNSFHGATYWFHQNDILNANLWEFNRINKANVTIRDNRFGGRVAGADGLNTIGLRGAAATPLSNNFYTLRFDHEINSKWHFNGSYIYFQTHQVSGGQNAQYDLRGSTPKATSTSPTDRDAAIAGLTGQITPHLLNTFRFGWVRARQSFNRLAPSAAAALENIAGTNSSAGAIAMAPGQAQTNLVDAPIEVDTQRARFQNIVGRNIQYVDDLSWIKSKHTFQFGMNIRHIPTIHTRNDKVVGSLASLEALLDADVSTFLTSIPSSERPLACSTTVTTNCLQSGDARRWDRLYASTLGLVDNVGILTTRDGKLNPLPFGTPLINDTTLNAFEFYGQDVWRITPTLTLTYGLSYGWQTAPKEKLDRQTLVVDASTNSLLTGPGYIAAKQAAALQGKTFNPTLGFQPVKTAGRNIFDVDYGNVAPRVSAAWTPGFGSGFLNRLVGNRKTVVRGGFGIVYDRTNTVQSVIIPMLGVGVAQTGSVGAPLCNASGTPGPGCNAGATASKPGAASFRAGVGGKPPVPTVPAVTTTPVVPSAPFGELFSFQDDPATKIGRSYAADLTIQREIPGNMIVEIGWTGRWSNRLPQGVNFNSAPYFFVDPASKQTFAQAYDAVTAALAAGQTPLAQPFFENQLAGLIGSSCASGSTATTATQFLANAAGPTFTRGAGRTLFFVVERHRALPYLPNLQERQMGELHIAIHSTKPRGK